MTTFPVTESKTLLLTFGRLSEIDDDKQFWDLFQIWGHALIASDYEPLASQVIRIGGVDKSRAGRIEPDLLKFFGVVAGVQRPEDEVVKCAKSAGVDYMLDSYFAGVSIDHILA
jgi:hypothetical protein